MRKITLVCSGHRENGRCNSDELLKILQELKPQVIFVEMRPKEFDFYYAHGNVEAHAINKYRKFKLFESVLVDRYEMNPSAEFKGDLDRVFDHVEQMSPEYGLLIKENYLSEHQHGFRYLNGATFATKNARMSEIEDAVIGETNDPNLILGLEAWRQLHQGREFEMVGNVYEYCRKKAFDTGVLLVGAAHKMGIVKGTEKYASTEADLINWDFAYDGQIPAEPLNMQFG